MRKIKLPIQQEITIETINYILETHKEEASRIVKLKKYYNAKNEILNRTFTDTDKPNNKLPHPYAAYITNMAIGHAFGVPVKYDIEGNHEDCELCIVNAYNDEVDHNMDLASWQSICGYGIELIYSDEEAKFRFTAADPSTIAIVYDMSVQENIQFAIRYFDLPKVNKDDKPTVQVEVYTKDTVTTYIKEGDKYTLQEQGPHNFNDVPVSLYSNNTDMVGDFEKVLDLIDSYDKVESDSVNDQEYFTDAYLLLVGDYIENEDAQELRQKRMINLPNSDSSASFLTKQVNDTAVENLKTRIDMDIHKFSFIPDISNSTFTSNLSGESLKYKFAALNNICKTKHAKFKKGIMRRLELMFAFLGTLNNTEYTEIEPIFTLNMPKNDTELTQIALEKVTTQAISRKEYLINNEGYTEDMANEELKQIQLEKQMLEEGYSSMSANYEESEIAVEGEVE